MRPAAAEKALSSRGDPARTPKLAAAINALRQGPDRTVIACDISEGAFQPKRQRSAIPGDQAPREGTQNNRKNGASDGARTRDLRRDRPAL